MPRMNPKLATQAPVAMAEPLELPPPPPKVEIEQVLLRDITPSLYQPRRFQRPDAEDPDLLDLARSIRAKGVIQPILLRPIGAGYELVVGERRVRASRLELSELDAIGPAPLYIPAVVRQLSDSEAAELTVEENLRRKDLLPLEEADGVHTLLLLHKGDPLAVAARLGQTPTWVACRARIHSNLSTSWKELLADPDCPLRAWTAGHIEEIAKLAQEIQDEILNDLNFDSIDVHTTVPELRRHIADLTRKLGRAPFPLDDETLHPSVGACTNCPLMTAVAFRHLSLKAAKPLPPEYPRELLSIGDHLRTERLKRGLEQKEVAAILGVNVNTVTGWEVGRKLPKVSYMPAILGFIGYDPFPEGGSLGERLRIERWKLGLTQHKLGRRLGINQGTVSLLETGGESKSKRVMAAVRKFLDEAGGK